MSLFEQLFSYGTQALCTSLVYKNINFAPNERAHYHQYLNFELNSSEKYWHPPPPTIILEIITYLCLKYCFFIFLEHLNSGTSIAKWSIMVACLWQDNLSVRKKTNRITTKTTTTMWTLIIIALIPSLCAQEDGWCKLFWKKYLLSQKSMTNFCKHLPIGYM